MFKEPKQAIDIQKLAQPLVEYMRDNFNPHTTIAITSERIAVVEDVLSMPNSTYATVTLEIDVSSGVEQAIEAIIRDSAAKAKATKISIGGEEK